MSKKRPLSAWTKDILDSLNNIRADIGELFKDEFLNDGKTVRAVTKSIIDIGEASNRLMGEFPDLEKTNPDLWKHLKGVYAMRNKLTHGYFSIDAGVVWDTVQVHLPDFETAIKAAAPDISLTAQPNTLGSK